MSVSIHIERVVLDGISLSDSQQAILRQALARELRDLLARQPVVGWQQDWGQAFSHPLDIEIGGGDARQLGRQMAQAIHAGLTR